MARDPRMTRREGQYLSWMEAHRTRGRVHWKRYVYARMYRAGGLALLATGTLVALWTRVPHALLIGATFAIVLTLFACAVLYQLSMRGARARMTGDGGGVPFALMLAGAVLVAAAALAVRYA